MIPKYKEGDLILFKRANTDLGKCCIVLRVIEQRWGLAHSEQSEYRHTHVYLILTSFGQKKYVSQGELEIL